MNQLQERWQAHISARSEYHLELAVEVAVEEIASDMRKVLVRGFSGQPVTSGVQVRRRTVYRAA